MYIKVKAFPKSKKEVIKKISADAYEVHVKEEAQQNLANKRIIELVARELDVVVGRVRIINGHHSPSKMLSVLDMD